MTQTSVTQGLKTKITGIYRTHGDQSPDHIDTFLKKELASLDRDSRLDVLEKLTEDFGHPNQSKVSCIPIENHVLARVIKLLLGKEISEAEFNSDELLESLAISINTVFESLNQLISTINTTLVGKQDADQTIRQVIGYHLEGSDQARPLETYIGQIGKAFFHSQEASKKAAQAKVKQILDELAPQKIKKEADVSMLSPMRKSRCYDVYEHKYEKFENWFKSGRFMESYLREFERNCQKISF